MLHDPLPPDWIPPLDPVIEAYKQDVDVTLLRESLRRSVQERVERLMAWQRTVAELHEAGRRARGEA